MVVVEEEEEEDSTNRCCYEERTHTINVDGIKLYCADTTALMMKPQV